MKVTIELRYGPSHDSVFRAQDLDDQIGLLQKLAKGYRPSGADAVKLLDTASILRAIQQAIEKGDVTR